MKFVFIDSLPCFLSPTPFLLPGPPGCLCLPLLEPPEQPLCHISPSAPSPFCSAFHPLSSGLVPSLHASPPCWVHYTSSIYKFLLMCMKEMESNLSFVPVTLFSGFRYLIWGVVDFGMFASVVILPSLVTVVWTSRVFFFFFLIMLATDWPYIN